MVCLLKFKYRELMKKIVILSIIVFITILLGYIYYNSVINKVIEQETELIIEIPYNTTTYKVIQIFNSHGYLKPNWLFKYIINNEIKTKRKFISAGIYQIPIKISNKELIEKLFSNAFVNFKKLQIIEGTTLNEFAEIYAHTFNTNKTNILKLINDPKFINSLNIKSSSLEGYINPDTYFFLDETPEKNIQKLVQRQKDVLNNICQNKKVDLQEYDILILASIIQAEAANEEEMPLISSVYHNRLKLGMLLQADPTILYGKNQKNNLTKKDLKDRSNPYNTYIYSGLPPTPINSPGRKAIYAAANPANTNYLFFVLKSDTSKTHYFSTNYREHLNFVKKYKNSLKN